MSLTEAGYSVVAFTGDLDLNDRERIVDALRPLATAEAPLVDLTDVTYLDSTVLGALVGLNKSVARRGKRVSIIVGSERVLKIFTMTRLNEVFDVFTSREAALRKNIIGLNPNRTQAS